MPEPKFLTDVALTIPVVHELWSHWRQILVEIDALAGGTADPFVDYPRYRIHEDGPFLYENDWKVLPTTVIDRAKTILERLEADDSSHNLLRKRMKKENSGEDTKDEDDQLALF